MPAAATSNNPDMENGEREEESEVQDRISKFTQCHLTRDTVEIVVSTKLKHIDRHTDTKSLTIFMSSLLAYPKKSIMSIYCISSNVLNVHNCIKFISD